MTATASVSPTGNAYVDSLFGGTKWTGSTLTYSFPTDPTLYVGAYGIFPYGAYEENNNFKAFNAVQQAAVNSILSMYSTYINLTFTEITETSTQSATIRYAESDATDTAYTYLPSTTPEGGDAWFNNSTHWYDNPVLGNYAWDTLIHETGHALGLKHPFQASGSFGTMPTDRDSVEYTVMSYSSYVGGPTTGYTLGATSYPQSLMMYDIAALQTMYGANYTTNSGNTVYSWSPTTGQEFINGVAQTMPAGDKIFQTIWDGGGTDTYDFSNYTTNLSIDLRPGDWTTVSTTQLANLGSGHNAAGNIANSLLYQGNTGSLIEDAIGGSGNDTIIGNAADNKLTGGAGNDNLDGQGGINTAVYSGASGNYQWVHNADGTWTVTDLRTGSPDGTDTLTNIQFLQFSNGAVALNASVAPAAPVIAGYTTDSGVAGDHITNDATPTLSGTAEASSTVKLYDGAASLGTTTANSSGSWSYTTAALGNGAHSFTATATDSGGTSVASSALSLTIDTAAPAAPVIGGYTTDSGIAGDHITNDATPTLSGTAEANSTVKVYDGASLLGTAAANGSGAWSFTTAALANRAHSLTATATDAAGNVSAASAALSVTVDTIAPAAPSIASFSPDSGTVGDGLTKASTLTLTGSAEANSTVKVYDGASLLGTAAANGAGAWSFTTGTLANGAHSLTATAADAAGNVSVASAALPVTVDTVAPAAPSIASFSPDSGTVGDGLTDASTLTLTGSADANSTVKVYDGASLLGTAAANGAGAWSFTTGTLANGAHSLTAVATDAAGNVSAASAALSVTVDTIAPAAPSIASFSPDSGAVGDGITDASTLTLTGSAEANSTVKVYDGASLLGTAAANGSGAWSFTTAALANGGHRLTATATDAAGNVSATSAALSVTVDTAGPLAPTIASFSPDSGAVGDGITDASTLTLTGSAEANSTVKVYDGASLLGTAAANGSGAWSFTTGALANGAHSLTAVATDAGSASAASAALEVTVDTSAPLAPTIASFGPDSGVSGDQVTNSAVLNLAGTAEARSTVRIYDGATLLGSASADAAGAWNYTTTALADGAHSLTATATDAAGNTGVASAAFSITIDTVAPSAPTVDTFTTDSGLAGDHLTNDATPTLSGTAEAYTSVHIYDGQTLLGSVSADGAGRWSYTTAALADGKHNLTATATDAAGNTGASSIALLLTIDTVAPSAPHIDAVETIKDALAKGSSNAHTFAFTGSAEANSTVHLYDGATWLADLPTDSTGAWSYTVAGLSNGTHRFAASATDLAGNLGPMSNALRLSIDSLAASEGPSNETFVYAPGDGAETITNFTAGPGAGDKIDLTAFSNIRSLDAVLAHATESNGNSVLDFGNGDTLTLANVLESSLTPDDFLLPLNPPHDFNADAMSDLLWQNDNGAVSIWEMNGTNVIYNPMLADNPGPSSHAIGTGDFNGDGFADVLWQNTNGAVSIWEMDGTRAIDKATLSVNPGPAWHVIGTGDFNGDGFADILWQNTSGAISIWEMDGADVLHNPTLKVNPGPSWHVIGTGDFNGDGKSDILWQNNNGAVSIWEMDGTNVGYNPTLSTNLGPTWHVIDAGDFNGDGKSDILWQNDTGAASIWEMNGTSITAQASIGNPGSSTHAVNVADYNGDGKADIAWQDTNGAVSLWEMDGSNVLAQSTLGVNPGTHWHVIGPNHGLVT